MDISEAHATNGSTVAILAFMESIDRRLGVLEGKVDAGFAAGVSHDECTRCQRQWFPRKQLGYLTGATAGLLGIAALAGEWLGVGRRLSEWFK